MGRKKLLIGRKCHYVLGNQTVETSPYLVDVKSPRSRFSRPYVPLSHVPASHVPKHASPSPRPRPTFSHSLCNDVTCESVFRLSIFVTVYERGKKGEYGAQKTVHRSKMPLHIRQPNGRNIALFNYKTHRVTESLSKGINYNFDSWN